MEGQERTLGNNDPSGTKTKKESYPVSFLVPLGKNPYPANWMNFLKRQEFLI